MARLAPDVPVPASRTLEEALIPSPESIAAAAGRLARERVR
jgi:pyruvate/2-oxoglutarate/acetoin dehydrogenase E1 component